MPPDLSVLLVVGERRDRAVRALASVLSQDALDRLEILLLDLAPGEPAPLPGSGHPWLPPASRAEHAMLPGHNSSFKRDLLLAYGPGLEDLLRAEIVLHTRLHRDGHRLLLEPAAKFEHVSSPGEAAEITGQIAREGFPGVRFKRSERRLLPTTRTLGVERSRGELLAFTDPDVYARPDWLERLVAAYRATGELVVGALAWLAATVPPVRLARILALVGLHASWAGRTGRYLATLPLVAAAYAGRLRSR